MHAKDVYWAHFFSKHDELECFFISIYAFFSTENGEKCE